MTGDSKHARVAKAHLARADKPNIIDADVCGCSNSTALGDSHGT